MTDTKLKDTAERLNGIITVMVAGTKMLGETDAERGSKLIAAMIDWLMDQTKEDLMEASKLLKNGEVLND